MGVPVSAGNPSCWGRVETFAEKVGGPVSAAIWSEATYEKVYKPLLARVGDVVALLIIPVLLVLVAWLACKHSEIWRIAMAAGAAGCFGGALGDILNGASPPVPAVVRSDVNQAPVFHPGKIGNVLAGGAAALVLFGLYGPLASHVLLGQAGDTITSSGGTAAVAPFITFSGLIGAFVTGLGGTTILATQVNNNILKAGSSGAPVSKGAADT